MSDDESGNQVEDLSSDEGEVIFDCSLCDAIFEAKHEIEMHVKTVHKENKDCQCDQCGKVFNLKASLQTHIRFVHKKERNHKCPICDKAYKTRERVKMHLAGTHGKLKLFKCEQCDASFATTRLDLNSSATFAIKHSTLHPC